MVYSMKVRNKQTGEIVDLGEGVSEVLNAFIVPLQCLYKRDYEKVEDEEEKGE